MLPADAPTLLRPPSLAYHHAFDLAAVWARGSATLGQATPFCQGHLGPRLSATATKDVAVLCLPFPSGHALRGAVQAAAPSTTVIVLSHGLLARVLPERVQAAPTDALASAQLGRAARALGLRFEDAQGFHGPTALVWGRAHELALRAGRNALADRALIAMRASFSAAGKPWWAAPVAVTRWGRS